MQNLSEVENAVLGSTASFFQATVLQPTIYWKNARQQGLSFTLNPRVLYRGFGAALCNEMGQMGFQYAATGYIKKAVSGGRPCTATEEISSALLGGAVVGPYASLAECIMIQQQRFGGSLLGTSRRILRSHGSHGLFRGLIPCTIRDGVYVGGLLGITPVVQDRLIADHGFSQAASGFWASMLAGVVVGVITCPFDAISTCMKGDIERDRYGGFLATLKQRAAGGVPLLFGGVFWRVINIAGTIGISNEARVRLGPLIFPDKY